MGDEPRPTITIATEPTTTTTETKKEPPDPWKTFVANPGKLEAALAELEPGAPLVLGHPVDEALDLDAYTKVLQGAAAAGRDVVVVPTTG